MPLIFSTLAHCFRVHPDRMLLLHHAHDTLMFLAELFILFKLHAVLSHTDCYADHTVLDTPAIIKTADAQCKSVFFSISHTEFLVKMQAQELSNLRVTRCYLPVCCHNIFPLIVFLLFFEAKGYYRTSSFRIQPFFVISICFCAILTI